MKQVEIATCSASRLREAQRMRLPLEAILVSLQALKAVPREKRQGGICSNLIDPTDHRCVRDFIALYSPLWNEFSGNKRYPVIAENMGPTTAFHYGHHWVGRYGDARCRLLDFLIDCVETDLALKACLNSDKT